MKRLFRLAFVLLLALVSVYSGAAQTAQPRPATHRTTLQQPTEIQGYPCAKGYAWFYADGKLESCGVSRQTAFGEAQLPAQSIIVLLPDGRPDHAMMQHDSEVAGVKCQGGNRLLGSAEGSVTVFYPSGKLKLCFLAGDQLIQGVPCMTGGTLGFFGDGARRDGGAKFYESGKLHSCTLSQNFGSQHRGDHFTQAP